MKAILEEAIELEFHAQEPRSKSDSAEGTAAHKQDDMTWDQLQLVL